MYLTAHLLHRDEEEGINVFLHHHGEDFSWPPDPERLPDDMPGRVVARRIDLPPGGNQVRAYLDILAVDGTSRDRLREAISSLQSDLRERRNPTVFRSPPVTIRFGVEAGLERLRQDQLALLAAAAFAVLDDFAAAGG